MPKTSTDPPPRRLINLHEAATILGSSPDTVRRLISAGALKGYRPGLRQLRVDLDDLEAHIARSQIPTAGR